VADVNPAREIVKPMTAPGGAAGATATLAHPESPGLAPRITRGLAVRVHHEWLPRLAWTIHRTGRPGLVGIALLLASALFFVSTHLKVASEVAALRAELQTARTPARTAAPDRVADPAAAMPALPPRADMPAILRELFSRAVQARLAVDTGKYEIATTRSSGVVRYQIAFPVTGPYPQIRTFIDSTLAKMPAVALSDLVLERKSISDGTVEAQIRMTVYATAMTGAVGPQGARSATAAPDPRGAPDRPALPLAAATEVARAEAQPRAAEAGPASDRVVAPTHAAALFAQHSWFVLKPAPPPPPPPAAPPPPEPTAPPLPYVFLGSFAPGGEPPVYFLARGDRVIDAHVGDRLDGVYHFESAGGGQLVFVYLPLDIRQTLAAGASK
jgi:hypothetical protein